MDLEKFAFNEETKCEIRKKLAIPEDAFVLGHVGRFSYQKNHEYLIRIFAEVRKRNEHAVLMLIGDGENKPDVNVSEELEISDLVTFLELKEDVSEWADKILSYEGKEREDASEQIRSHGYDVQFTADEIEKMYLS